MNTNGLNILIKYKDYQNGFKNMKRNTTSWVKRILFLKNFSFERGREREIKRKHEQGEGQREMEREHLKRTPRESGVDPRTLRSRPEQKPRVRRLTDSATQAPLECIFLKLIKGRK